MKHRLLSLCALALFAVTSSAQSKLYGAAGGVLYEIDKSTGAGTPIGPIGFGGVTGLVFLNDGRLLASASDAAGALLIEIDPATGAGSAFAGGGGSLRYPDLAYDRASGRLWASANGPSEVVELDPATGAQIANHPLPSGNGHGLVWSDRYQQLYAVCGSVVYRIDPGGGTVLTESALFTGAYGAIASDPTSGVLYAARISGSGAQLAVLSPGDTVWGVGIVGGAPASLDSLAFSPPPVTGVPLLATTGDRGIPGRLMRIDPSTGFGTLIGHVGFNGLSGLARLRDGRLVASAVDPGTNGPILVELDRDTGQGTLIGPITGAGAPRIPDLTVDPLADVLFGYAHDGPSDGLVRIDPNTAAAVPAGPSGFQGRGNGLAWSPKDGELYAAPDDLKSLLILDPVTGASSTVPGSAGVLDTQKTLAFHPETGVLYGAARGSGAVLLQQINPATGVPATAGHLPKYTDAIVFDAPLPAPDPACVPRAGVLGLNPLDFTCAGLPHIGGTWTGNVKTAPSLGSSTLSTPVSVGLGGPTQGVPVFGYELLILPPYHQVVGVGTVAFPIPPVLPLLGVSVTAQGSRLELSSTGQIVIVLTNALDLTIGL